MLKIRVITALVLLGVLTPALFFASQLIWVLLVTGVVAAASWEWGRLLRAETKQQWFFVLFISITCLLLSFMPTINQPIYGLAVFFWCGIVPLWLRYKWILRANILGWLIGLQVLLPAWIAMVDLRLESPSILLAVLAIAWVADIAAYTAGKCYGKHKLAPSISPGKTWEGAAGAWLGVSVYGLVVLSLSSYTIYLLQAIAAFLVLTAVSVMGDLFESLLKRHAGLKDSSQLLPGHGGVLDRVDSLTSVLPVAAAMLILLK